MATVGVKELRYYEMRMRLYSSGDVKDLQYQKRPRPRTQVTFKDKAEGKELMPQGQGHNWHHVKCKV